METILLKELVSVFKLPGITLFISIAFLYTYKKLKGYYSYRKSLRIETIEKIIVFWKDYSGPNKEFVTEQLFFNHFRVLLSFNEITYFLSSSKPSLYLRLYIHARFLLEVGKSGDSLLIKNDKSLKKIQRKGLIWYWICGVTGMMIFLHSWSAFTKFGPALYAPWIVVLFCLFVLAWFALDQCLRAGSAMSLVKELEVKE